MQSLEQEILEQRKLSQEVGTLFQQAVNNNFNLKIKEAVDIGSYGRGTNTDKIPDIDIMFLGIPNDPSQSYADWTKLDTYELTGSWDGITDLSVVESFDPKLHSTVLQSLDVISALGRNPRFQWIRSWGDFPGVVFNVAIDHRNHGPLEFDVNFYHPEHYFGVEHTNRFNNYVARLVQPVATQLIKDIRRLKADLKIAASVEGKMDKTKKVPGYIVEAMFMHQPTPISHETLILMTRSHSFDQDTNLPERIPNQLEQLIDEGRNFDQVLLTLTRGGYQTLKSVT